MAAFCRSTWRRRSSGSGWVKSGEKQIIEVTCPVSSISAGDRIDVGRRQAAEEAVVVLDAFAAERRGVADPPSYGRRPSVSSSK